MRFLFVVPPLTGHVHPTVSVGRELASRGHEVAWVGHARAVSKLLPSDARFFSLGDELPADTFANEVERAREARGLLALKLLWESFFVPLARSMLDQVEVVLRDYRPDVVIVDQQTLAGAVAATRLGVPWVTSATTAAAITDPLAPLPQVAEWLRSTQAAVFHEAGVAAPDPPDQSPRLVLVFSTAALARPPKDLPKHVLFVGPASVHREETAPFPWDLLLPRRRVLVSLGTVPSQGADRFFGAVRDAFAEDDSVQLIVATTEDLFPSPPPSFIVRPFVPQLALLPHLHAVVCHAGQNTVSETLARGLPLVTAPIKYDQSVIAAQVEQASAGLRVKFGRVRGDELRHAVHRVLDEPSFAAAARAIAASFASAGGAPAAADALEKVTC